MAERGKAKQPRPAPARLAAFQVLQEMERSSSAHSDTLLHGHATERLSEQDRNLTVTLVMGVLRWQLALDAVIRERLHSAARLDAAVATALRLGAFQLLLLDRIPAHAAINDSVELTKRAGHRFAAGLVNAVLRGLAAGEKTRLDPVTAHPGWMVDRWRAEFGEAAAIAVCNHNQRTPRTTLRLPGDGPRETGVAPGEFLTRAGVLGEQDESAVAAMGEAAVERVAPGIDVVELRFQDEGSQLVAELAGEGRTILDCCAAPGGKTAILAERNPEARIVAGDISHARLAQMRRNFARDPSTARIECLEMDATSLPFGAEFDLILCDAPCSGTGTLARNPEIKLRLEAADLERQRRRQIAILRSAMRCVAPGGRLVYSTCSLEPEENQEVVQQCLEAQSDMRLLPMAERIEALERAGAVHAGGAARLRAHALRGDFLQTVPGVQRCDGFFAAMFTRG